MSPFSVIRIAKLLGGAAGKFMGGGASYVLIGITAFSFFQMVQIKHIKADSAEYKTERDDARKALKGKDSALKAQAEQNNRGKDLGKQGESAEEKINAQETEFKCAESKPIIAGLDWLRDFDAARADDNNNAADVSLQRAAKNAE